MTTTLHNCEYLNELIEAEKYKEAQPLALKLLPSMKVDVDDFDGESSIEHITCVIRGESGEDATKEEFEFAKSIFELSWSQQALPSFKKIIEVSQAYCERYEKYLSPEENISIREKVLSVLDDYSMRFNVTEMVVYLINTKQYSIALEKIELLESLNKSEALLFKSHLFRNGLGVEKSIFKSLALEVNSAKEFIVSDVMRSYGESYGWLSSYDAPLFKIDYDTNTFSVNQNTFLWYMAHIETESDIGEIILEMRKMRVFDSVERDKTY